MNNQREEFEALQTSHGLFPCAIERYCDGCYVFIETNNAWTTWQQAWKAAKASQTREQKEPRSNESLNIDKEFDKFFEFETDDKSVVTSVSCKLFAKHIADLCAIKNNTRK